MILKIQNDELRPQQLFKLGFVGFFLGLAPFTLMLMVGAAWLYFAGVAPWSEHAMLALMIPIGMVANCAFYSAILVFGLWLYTRKKTIVIETIS